MLSYNQNSQKNWVSEEKSQIPLKTFVNTFLKKTILKLYDSTINSVIIL